jgi:hypothetical protein
MEYLNELEKAMTVQITEVSQFSEAAGTKMFEEKNENRMFFLNNMVNRLTERSIK